MSSSPGASGSGELKKSVDYLRKEYVLSFNSVPETKIAESANSVDLDDEAHNEPPHLDLHCLSSRAGPRSAIGRTPDS